MKLLTRYCLGVKIEDVSNNYNVRYFHCRQELVRMSRVLISTKSLITSLKVTAGVIGATVSRHKIRIEKSEIYSWAELDKSIRLIFAKYLPRVP